MYAHIVEVECELYVWLIDTSLVERGALGRSTRAEVVSCLGSGYSRRLCGQLCVRVCECKGLNKDVIK